MEKSGRISGFRLLVSVLLALAIVVPLWPADASADGGTPDVVVRLKPGGNINDVNRRQGTRTVGEVPERGAYRLQTHGAASAPALTARLGADPDVAEVTRNPKVAIVESQEFDMEFAGQFVDPRSPRYLDRDRFERQQAWRDIRLNGDVARRGEGDDVIIALLDTGVLADHELIRDRLTRQQWDFVRNDAVADEERGPAYGHGTFLAGLIGQVAPEARILPLKVLNGHGLGTVFDVVAAMYHAKRAGAQVINMSLTTDVDVPILREAVEDLSRAGITIVAATGNHSHREPNEVLYPARYAASVAVVATISGSERAARFTNSGRQADLAAPGTDLISAFPGNGERHRRYGLAVGSGTSMATAIVSGAVAVLRGDGQELSSEQAIRQLRQTATSLDAANPDLAGQLGAGRIDLCAAVRACR